MGCHTWFSRKSSRTIEEAREILINRYKKHIKMLAEDFTTEDKIMLYEDFYESKHGEKTEEEILLFYNNKIEHDIAVINRKIQIISKGLCNVAVMKHQSSPDRLSYYFPDKGFFIGCDDFHNCFRLHGYPEDMLFSKEETYKFLEDNKNNPLLEIHENTYKWLDEFWDKYPDGFIHFG